MTRFSGSPHDARPQARQETRFDPPEKAVGAGDGSQRLVVVSAEQLADGLDDARRVPILRNAEQQKDEGDEDQHVPD